MKGKTNLIMEEQSITILLAQVSLFMIIATEKKNSYR